MAWFSVETGRAPVHELSKSRVDRSSSTAHQQPAPKYGKSFAAKQTSFFSSRI
jgi:hypothetical protein